MPETRDKTMPVGKWEFNDDVTNAFSDMLQRSIPQYDVMRDAVLSVGRQFAQQRTHVLDIGCSRGEALAPFVEEFYPKPKFIDKFVGVEISEPMLAAARKRFEGHVANGIVEILPMDLRVEYPQVRASVTLSVFTLQFIPIEHRQRVVQDVYDHTVHGGAFILVEKVLGETARLDRVMVERYYRMKADNGYSQEAIERKRLSLEGVLVPVTASWNMELLRQAGFKEIDTFWAWMNFRGFVGVKR